MATITISVNTGQGTMTRAKTVTGAHLVRAIAAMRVFLNRPAQDTDTQVLEAWADSVFQRTKERVRDVELVVAEAASKASVTDIELT